MSHLITPQLLRPQSRGPRMFDSIRMKGFLQIRVLDALTRKALRIIQIPNTTCYGARVALEKIITQIDSAGAGTDALYNKLWAIGAGTSNVAAVNTQLDLVTGVFYKVIDPAQTIIDAGGIQGVAQVTMTMEAGQGNGSTYTECGLFSRGDDPDPMTVTKGIANPDAKMYARQVHAAIEKDHIIAIEYTWRFQFTV